MLEEQQTTLGVLSSMQTAAKAQKKTMQVRGQGAGSGAWCGVVWRGGWGGLRCSGVVGCAGTGEV